jgi:type I restriction enzyme S subunit
MENLQLPTSKMGSSCLKYIPFRDIVLWDVKRYASERIRSEYPIVRLGLHIQEESHKVKLYDYQEKEFGILGVNNKVGIFDAYTEKGKNINQSYKKMEEGWLAYNPYRVNVGSIGLRTDQHKHNFISPAYVVFSCKETLLPDFLFKLFKTDRFNKIIKESTTGSVRQNLTIDILKTLSIPLPQINVQQNLLDCFYKKTELAEKHNKEIEALENKIERYFHSLLGVSIKENNIITQGLKVIRFRTLTRWAISYIRNIKSYAFDEVKYNIVPLKTVISFFEGGKTPSTSHDKYWDGNICWTSPKDFRSLEISDSEDKISEEAVKAGFKVYPVETILGVFRSGILRHSFPVAVTKVETAINQDLKAMDVKPELIDKTYFLLYLHSFQKLILEMSSKVGVTVESINSDEFLEIPIILPPLNKQREIANEILTIRQEINNLKGNSERYQIEAIKEFEKAVIE